MPVSLTSRYQGLPVYSVNDPLRGATATIAIREPTPPPAGTQLYRHALAGAETVDALAQRFFGSSDTWWRIAEANPLVFPLDLRPGFGLNIPAIDDVGRIVRNRRF